MSSEPHPFLPLIGAFNSNPAAAFHAQDGSGCSSGRDADRLSRNPQASRLIEPLIRLETRYIKRREKCVRRWAVKDWRIFPASVREDN